MLKKVSALLLSTVLLVSCGGGGGGSSGGGGGGGGGGSVVFTADKSSITLAYDEDAFSMPAANVTVTASGSFSGTLYIGAVVDGNGIDPNIQTVITGTQATFTILAKSGMAAGSYSGRISLLGCSDQNCNKQIGNSPIVVSYTLTVRTTLKASPASVNGSSNSGSTASQDVIIRLPSNATGFQASVSAGIEFLSVDQVTANGFRILMHSLPQGSYNGTVRVVSGNTEINIPVNYVVGAGVARTEMVVSQNNLTLAGIEGAVSTPVMLNVTPPSWDPVTRVHFTSQPWSTSDAPTWLSSAAVTGGHAITVDATTLTAGTYTAFAWVSGGWPTQDVQVPIALTIGPGLQRPADVMKIIGAQTTLANLSGTVPVNVVAGPASNWTASVNAPWLQLTHASGATGQTLDYSIDYQQLAALDNGAEYVAHVTITPQRTTMTPVAFDLRLSKRLPAITHVGPYILTALQPARFILRGVGFASVTNLTTGLHFAGATVNSVTLVNDTEVVVKTGPLTHGSWTLSYDNALSLAAGSGRLKTIMPTLMGTATLPTGGNLRGLFYDAERMTAYAVNVDLESLQRFKVGTQWQVDSVPVPAILSAGLTQDGSRILVASSASGTSRIRQLDAADFTVEKSAVDVPVLYRGFTYLTGAIPTTNDGRSWFAVGDTWNSMASFDPVTQLLTPYQTDFQTDFYGGPWFSVSRDGERLLVPQSGSISPAPPALYLDAADSLLHANPAGLTNTYRMSQSDDGNRFIYDNYEVRDLNYVLVGRIPTLPRLAGEPSYYVLASQLSPDGARLYAISYPDAYGYEGYPARIFVFDSSTRQTSSSDLPLLGYYNLSDYPTCTDWVYGNNCSAVIHTAISPDGLNLYMAGNTKFIVTPAANLGLTTIPVTQPPAQKQRQNRMTPWHLELAAH